MRGDRIAWLRTDFSRGNAFLAHAPFYYGGDHRSKRPLERVTILGPDGSCQFSSAARSPAVVMSRSARSPLSASSYSTPLLAGS
jgi:hypothetical protein